MKAIRLILAIYITTLTVYPCSDNKTCLDERKAGMALVNQTNHDHNSSEQDLCTPFCTCSCCAVHVQINKAGFITSINPDYRTKLSTAYLEKPILNNSHSIWQPPKS